MALSIRQATRWTAVAAALVIALAPALAEARAGRGSSTGSRGERTYSAPPPTQTAPGGAQPIQRSLTPPGTTAAASGYRGAAAGRGFFARNPFLGGLLAGGLVGMLLGGGLLAGGGFGALMGALLQILLIAGLVFLVIRLFRRRAPAAAGMPHGQMRQGLGPEGGYAGRSGGGVGRPGARDEVGIVPADYQAFEQVLAGVQAAWSERDRGAMSRIVTPEMMHWFTEQLTEEDATGRINKVEQVRLLQGDLAEAWSEGARQYATVAMRFAHVDYWVDRASGRVVAGDPNRVVEATEVWTFVRPRGGRWVLSAIQQTD